MFGLIIPIGIGGLVAFALWFWAVFDCIATDGILVRNLPKQTWIFIVIFVPTAGALAWLLLGRPEGAGLALGGTYRPPNYTERAKPARGFEDSAAWDDHKRSLPDRDPPASSDAPSASGDISESPAVKARRLAEWEAELTRREAELDGESDNADTDEA